MGVARGDYMVRTIMFYTSRGEILDIAPRIFGSVMSVGIWSRKFVLHVFTKFLHVYKQVLIEIWSIFTKFQYAYVYLRTGSHVFGMSTVNN